MLFLLLPEMSYLADMSSLKWRYRGDDSKWEDIQPWRGESTRFIELGDRLICPGFCDNHTFLPAI